MKLEQLRKEVTKEYKKWSSINYFIQSPVFKFIYDSAFTEDKVILQVAALNGKQYELKNYIKERKAHLAPFEKLGVRKLKAIAKHLHIPQWYKMTKLTLVEEINNEVYRVKTDSKQVINKPER